MAKKFFSGVQIVTATIAYYCTICKLFASKTAFSSATVFTGF
jgi:hypothetical protein